MRLIDRIRIEFSSIPEDLPIIVADPVAQQIDQLPGDTWSESPPAEAYGCVAPPFHRFFVEAETAVDLAELGSIGTQIIQRGVLAEVEDRENGWQYVFTPFIWYQPAQGSAVVGTHTVNGRIFLNIDKAGLILDDLEAVRTAVFDQSQLTADKMRSYVSFLPFVLKALSVLHQRTVVERVTHTRQQRRLHQRRHKSPLSDYYLLTVKPSSRVESIADVAQPVAPTNRREHIVRGHFRYYTPERPLFGRYSGMVWIAEHHRGDPDAGSIRKDYLVDSEP